MTTAPLSAEMAELQDLLAKATKGPWTPGWIGSSEFDGFQIMSSDGRLLFNITQSYRRLEPRAANAELICFLRNHAESLLASPPSPDARVQELRQWIENYPGDPAALKDALLAWIDGRRDA